MAYSKRDNIIVDKNFYFGCDIVNFSRELKKFTSLKLQVN